MSSIAKLKSKLERGSIKARELRTLMHQSGWQLDRTKGSHEVWIKGAKTFILATHSQDLKLYQIKQVQSMLLVEGYKNG